MSFWEDWFKRHWERRFRRRPTFFEEIDRVMEDMFIGAFKDLPEDLFKEHRMPDGSRARIFGPFLHGYSMTIGPEGEPIIREFGNLKPSRTGIPKPTEIREPFVDIITGDKVVQVIAEVPGVDKSDIDLNIGEDLLRISVDTEERKYRREVDLPEKVDPDSAKASYRNGVLQVTLNKLKERKPSGKRITVE